MKTFARSGLRLLQRGGISLGDYDDTVRRLLRGGFGDLSPQQREERVEQIIQAAAVASMTMGSVPIPFLEIPVLAAMVRAIGTVYGAERPGKKALWELMAALGGGLVLRQVLRMLPFGGLSQISRLYGATWALGRAAQVYFGGAPAAAEEDLREAFRETLESKTREQKSRLDAAGFAAKVKALQGLRAQGLITEQEFNQKRGELLARL